MHGVKGKNVPTSPGSFEEVKKPRTSTATENDRLPADENVPPNQDSFEAAATRGRRLSVKARPDLPPGPQYISAARRALMEKIQGTYFQKQPESLLYLGSGADVVHPILATQAKKLVFVDAQKFDENTFRSKLSSLTGTTPKISAKDPTTTELSLKGQPKVKTESIEYHQSGYSRYFAKHPEAKYDVIFDKDSWLSDHPEDRNSAIASLKEGGRWISNEFSGVAPFEELFEASGLKRITHQINNDPVYETPFGNLGNVEVLEKTKDFNEAAMRQVFETWGTLQKLKSNTIDEGIPLKSEEDFEFFIDLIDMQIDQQIQRIKANDKLPVAVRSRMVDELNTMRDQWKLESENLKDYSD